MAASSSWGSFRKVQSLEDLLICPVCLDSLQDPRTLCCLHTFCTNCLEGCRKHHRRDFECPVCKRLTSLTSLGIQGLPIDHRIQQIRDIISQSTRMQNQTKGSLQTQWLSAEQGQSLSCDLCRTQHKRSVAATSHCIQCFMYFCELCLKKHDGNLLFVGHDRIFLKDTNALEVLFCRQHKEHPFRYFCRICHLLLCTICTMDHDPSHMPEALEKGVIEKYRQNLEESLRTIASKLKEVKTKAKCLDTVRQTHQSSLYQVQTLIKERAGYFISQIREQERSLLEDAQEKFDIKMKGYGLEKMAEMTFFKANLETLLNEIHLVIKGSPQLCLLKYDELMSRVAAVSETSFPSVGKYKTKKAIKFIPSSEELDLMIGTLQEISIDDEFERHDEDNGSQSPSTTGELVLPRSNFDFTSSSPHLRKRTILNALSPVRKDIKIGRVKSVNKSNPSSTGLEVIAITCTNDAAVEPGTKTPDTEVSSGMSSVVDASLTSSAEQSELSTSLPSPSSTTADGACNRTIPNAPSPSSTTTDGAGSRASVSAKLIFNVDQVGGMPGKISYPSSVAFLPNGHIVISECEHRLQVFDSTGQSIRVIGWGKIRPQSVVVTPAGLIACTDKKEQTIKIYQSTGEISESWPARMFGMPSGIAISSCGNFIVTDVDRSSVSIHDPRGNVGLTILPSAGLWTDTCHRLNSPAHVAIDRNDNLFVSDSAESCVQMFDKTGKFVLRFALPNSTSGTWYNSPFRPQGLCIDPNGNVAICDVDNHRISLFSPDGNYLMDLLTEQNGLKHPCNVAISSTGNEIAIVESHGGIFTNNPRHSLKLFSLE